MDEHGRLADNIALFARTLRKAGLRIGPAATLSAIGAARVAGFSTREDFYWVLHATLVCRHEDHAVFDEAFRLFWRPHDLNEKMIAMFSPKAPPRETPPQKPRPGEARVRDALTEGLETSRTYRERPELDIDAKLTAAATEVLRSKDFAQMSAAELDEARRAIAMLALPQDVVISRRTSPDAHGHRFDPRATMRRSMRTGGDLLVPHFRSPRVVQPPLVVIADISGSMSQYSRMMMFFLHALAERRRHIHVFLFGTRLTNVSRQIRRRDPDAALAACAEAVKDWSGGTRIGEVIARFNRQWSRRVLGGKARVLLITDGLELGDTHALAHEMERLHKSCARLVWLNPLLRYEGFAARSRGVRAMLPHVDEFRSVHSLEAMADLCRSLSGQATNDTDPRRWLTDAEPVAA